MQLFRLHMDVYLLTRLWNLALADGNQLVLVSLDLNINTVPVSVILHVTDHALDRPLLRGAAHHHVFRADTGVQQSRRALRGDPLPDTRKFYLLFPDDKRPVMIFRLHDIHGRRTDKLRTEHACRTIVHV